MEERMKKAFEVWVEYNHMYARVYLYPFYLEQIASKEKGMIVLKWLSIESIERRESPSFTAFAEFPPEDQYLPIHENMLQTQGKPFLPLLGYIEIGERTIYAGAIITNEPLPSDVEKMIRESQKRVEIQS